MCKWIVTHVCPGNCLRLESPGCIFVVLLLVCDQRRSLAMKKKGWKFITTVFFTEMLFPRQGTFVGNRSGMLMLDPLVNSGMVPRPSSWLRLELTSRFSFEPRQPSATLAKSCCLVVTRRFDFRSFASCSRMSIICSDRDGAKKRLKLTL